MVSIRLHSYGTMKSMLFGAVLGSHSDQPIPTCIHNGSGESGSDRVQVGTELLPNGWSGLSIQPTRQFGYGSLALSQPIPIRWAVSASPSRST